jgi:hypothetical protein
MFGKKNANAVTQPDIEGLLPIVENSLQKEVFQKACGE